MGRTRKNLVPWPWEMEPLGEGTLKSFAQSLNIGNPAEEFERFRDYHLQHGSRFADWGAAWRTWCRNAAKFAAERAPTGFIQFTPDGIPIAGSSGPPPRNLPANVAAAMKEEEGARAAVQQMDEAARKAAQQKFGSLISQIGKKVPR